MFEVVSLGGVWEYISDIRRGKNSKGEKKKQGPGGERKGGGVLEQGRGKGGPPSEEWEGGDKHFFTVMGGESKGRDVWA